MIKSYDSYSDHYEDQIRRFQSGDSQVDDFIIEEAGELHDLCAARTRLYFNDEEILAGYFTLMPTMITISESIRRGWGLETYRSNHPAIHILYFGVSNRFQRRGYGRQMMMDIIHLTRVLAIDIGCRCLVLEVSASNVDAIEFYKKMDFIVIEDSDEDQPYLKMALRIAPYDPNDLE